MSDDMRLLTSKEAADYLNLKPKTLAEWRLAKTGPPYVKLGDGRNARVMYVRAEIVAWLRERRVDGGSP